jgi:hypothetical protein
VGDRMRNGQFSCQESTMIMTLELTGIYPGSVMLNAESRPRDKLSPSKPSLVVTMISFAAGSHLSRHA